MGSGSPTTIRGMLVGDPLTGNPLAVAGLQLAGLRFADFRPPTPCIFGAILGTPIARSLIEIYQYFMLKGCTLADDLTPYCLLSGVAPSYLLASLLCTAYFQEVGSLLDYTAGLSIYEHLAALFFAF